MAAITRQIGTIIDGTVNVKAEYIYDDVSLLITTVRLTNTGATGILTAALLTSSGGIIQSYTHTFGAGVRTVDVSGQNQHMVLFTETDGAPTSYLVPPFTIEFGWHN